MEENQRLKQQNLMLQTEVSTINYAIQQTQAPSNPTITMHNLYHTLAQSLPTVFSSAIQAQLANIPSKPGNLALTSMSSPDVALDQPLNHTDYPNVRFWFRRDWLNRKKEISVITKVILMTEPNKDRVPSGLNVTLCYVEGVDGVVVDGYCASEMRKFARCYVPVSQVNSVSISMRLVTFPQTQTVVHDLTKHTPPLARLMSMDFITTPLYLMDLAFLEWPHTELLPR